MRKVEEGEEKSGNEEEEAGKEEDKVDGCGR